MKDRYTFSLPASKEEEINIVPSILGLYLLECSTFGATDSEEGVTYMVRVPAVKRSLTELLPLAQPET